ncbi:MAG TPA: ribosomal protein S18-alanine N-acetyltransferase [Pyrinomonadaceae bacterium]|nr:ribosomal protein S18-alanine N-acetyltransferase [Pyrinomonadaceae bacterium]
MATAETAATTASLNVQIDHMTEHDLLEVCQIEGLSDLSAWGWDAYHKELQVAPETVMLAARLNPPIDGIEIAGFIVARVIASELHVNNVAVRPEFQRLHLGLALLQRTIVQAKQRGARVAHLEVRAGNQAAQELYRRCGFREVGRRKRYYRSPTEDALLMSLSL